MTDTKNTEKKELLRLKRLIGKYREAVNLKNELENYKNSVESIKQGAETSNSSISNILAEAQKSPEGLKQITNEATTIKDSIVQISTQIESKRDIIVNLETKVTGQSKKLQEDQQKYTDLLSQIFILKEEVKKQLAVATGGTLATSFLKRQDELKFGSRLWLILFILSSLVLVFAGIIIVEQIIRSNLSNSPISLIKVLITLPLFYIVRFFGDGYKRERNLEEEYAFKSSVAFSLAGYQKLLKDELPDGSNTQVIEFITKSISSIYSTPRRDISKIVKEEKNILEDFIALVKEVKK